MNAPIFLLIAAWLLFAFVELATHFPAKKNSIGLPADTPPADADEDADNLPFGPTPRNQD